MIRLDGGKMKKILFSMLLLIAFSFMQEVSTKKNTIIYTKSFNEPDTKNNSLDKRDVLFELCPELFYLIHQYRDQKISIFDKEKVFDKITNKLTFFKCSIEINETLKIFVKLTSNLDTDLTIHDNKINFKLNKPLFNSKELKSFVNSKNSFENLSIFTYYPYKLFQEVLNE